jgi:hypothetical protein
MTRNGIDYLRFVSLNGGDVSKRGFHEVGGSGSMSSGVR